MCLPPQLERVVTALPETQAQLAAASERADLVLAAVKQLEIRSMLTDQTLEEMEVRDDNNIHTILFVYLYSAAGGAERRAQHVRGDGGQGGGDGAQAECAHQGAGARAGPRRARAQQAGECHGQAAEGGHQGETVKKLLMVDYINYFPDGKFTV